MDRSGDNELVVLPPVHVDPVFAEAVEDAVSGEQPLTSPYDPERAVGADPHDFAGLYIRHRSSFALHARRFLRDQRDVDEVVQEAFLRLFLALPGFETELQALAYCRRTITNLCIDRYRADKRRPRLVDLDSVPPDALPEDETDDPVIQAEDAAIVREALALLSPLHREALVKREIEEKPLPVIAAELNIPEESVKHLLHRARRALRRRLAETHLAPGVDVDSVSTLSLLAKSAAHNGGRLAVFVLLVLGAVLGATTRDLHVQTLSGLWQDVLPGVVHAPKPAPSPSTSLPSVVDATPGTPHLVLPPVLGVPATVLPVPSVPADPGPESGLLPVTGGHPATITVTTRPRPPHGSPHRPQPVSTPVPGPLLPEPAGSPSAPAPVAKSTQSPQPSASPSVSPTPSGTGPASPAPVLSRRNDPYAAGETSSLSY